MYSDDERLLLFRRTYHYIQKRNESGGIFHCNFDGVVEIVEVLFFKVVETVLNVYPYKEDIVYVYAVI